jgi:two-component system OmpR family sensor kinase
MHSDGQFVRSDADRLLATLEGLLSIRSLELKPALDEAAIPLVAALGADKIDVFLYDAGSDTLVAMGTSHTPMGDTQRRHGLDRMPLSNGGRVVRVFQTGISHLDGHVDQDPEELRGVWQVLGARSQIAVPMLIDGQPRGVLSALSKDVDKFTRRDLEFTEGVASWVGMIAGRGELAEQMTERAFERGRRKAVNDIRQLTARQREMAACIAEGLSNEEIAERLVVTPGTVANHVAAILDRLGLKNRTQIATWAVERGLYEAGQHASDSVDPTPHGPAIHPAAALNGNGSSTVNRLE